VVGGFIKHQQVAGLQQHQSQGESGFFSPREFARLFEHTVIGEAEASQKGAHLGLGPVGNSFIYRVDNSFFQIEGFSLVLLKVSGHDVVLANDGMTIIWLFDSHD
jgi:hypothetical protein